MKDLLKALSEAKKEIGAISKDSTNPFFKSKYFDINQLLAHVEPILERHGLMVTQPILNNSVYSHLYHIESGKMIESVIELPTLTDPQKLGSAITYYRRYTLGSLLSLQAEDDDGNKASKVSYKFGFGEDLPWVSDQQVDDMIDYIKTDKQKVITKLMTYKWSKANKEKITNALNK